MRERQTDRLDRAYIVPPIHVKVGNRGVAFLPSIARYLIAVYHAFFALGNREFQQVASGTLNRRIRTSRRPSATVPIGDQDDADVLELRRVAWNSRPLTREVYARYFEFVRRELSTGSVTIELGGGAGNLKESLPHVWVSDIVATRHVDFVGDAMRLPLKPASVDNLIIFDVLHHLPQPVKLFDEAVRVLRSGGRIVMLEPYISPLSRCVFKVAHPEPVDLGADPLLEGDQPVFNGAGPFASNQAIPTLLFFRHFHRFRKRFPQLRLRTRRRDSVFVYPLSGGFSGPCLVPRFAHRWVWAAEHLLSPLRRWMAFRLLVTLERVD